MTLVRVMLTGLMVVDVGVAGEIGEEVQKQLVARQNTRRQLNRCACKCGNSGFACVHIARLVVNVDGGRVFVVGKGIVGR